MLQLAVKNSDLRRITKLFAINHIVGEIESDKILIEHEISENILGNILDCAEVSAASIMKANKILMLKMKMFLKVSHHLNTYCTTQSCVAKYIFVI